MKRLVVFLNGERGLSTLAALIESGCQICRVVVPLGKLQVSERARSTSAAFGDIVREEENVNSSTFLDSLESLGPELCVIAGYSNIFGKPLLSIPKRGTLNLHAGRLPQYRGGSPLNWQIINGEKTLGLSVVLTDAGIDTGDVVTETTFSLPDDAKIAEAHARANGLFPRLTVEAITALDEGRPLRRQDDRAATYWHQRSDADGQIFWRDQTARQIHDLVRAISSPYPGAFSYSDGQRIRIMATRIPEIVIRGVPGRVCYLQGSGPYVLCNDRAILVTRYLIEGAPTARLRHGTLLT